MSKKNKNAPAPEQENVTVKQSKKKKKKKGGLFGRIVRRFFLLLFTVILLLVADLCLVLNLVFNGPSNAASEILTMALTEASATKWVPGVFMDDERVEAIRASVNIELPDEYTDVSQVVINMDSGLGGSSDEWANYPDGIRIESYAGNTFNAHIMIVRDPSRVYMGTSAEKFSTAVPGKRITEAMEATPDAIAAVNAGAFYDDGTSSPVVGSVPAGLVFAGGGLRWDAYHGLVPQKGFAGFNKDNILIVAKSMTAAEAEAQGIRDGCEFGPVLIMNGEINMEAYNNNSGLNPRTAIGQRADGTVIFVCIDGRQANSLGGTYRDVIDIMIEYGAVNACNMDGGSSSVMLYRDTYGLYGEAGQVQMINNYSLLQSQPRRMPNYWMVSETGKE